MSWHYEADACFQKATVIYKAGGPCICQPHMLNETWHGAMLLQSYIRTMNHNGNGPQQSPVHNVPHRLVRA